MNVTAEYNWQVLVCKLRYVLLLGASSTPNHAQHERIAPWLAPSSAATR